MHNFLQSLELTGFKSFASKTTLEFRERIVAIVGPNGSGKSNIIDALRWVLGEREAKNLRGETLGNLIFAGTVKKPAMSLAKVTLTFNNASRELPFDFETVAISRKIDKSGVSKFYCNDEEIRFKELAPLLARARLSSRGLTMIGQSQSDLFVRSTPEERRMMIEEVLGLKEYRLKKNQAENRLEQSRINMEKVSAVLEELAPHLRFLRKQKNRFDKRSEIETNLEFLEKQYYSFHYHHLKNGLEAYSHRIREIQIQVDEETRNINRLEEELNRLNQTSFNVGRTKELRQLIEKKLKNRSEAERQLARWEARLEFETKTDAAVRTAREYEIFIENLEQNLQSAARLTELVSLRRQIEEILTRIKDFFHRDKKETPQEWLTEKKRLAETIQNLNRELEENHREEDRLAAAAEGANREFREQVEILERAKNERRRWEGEIQKIAIEKERVLVRLQDLEHNWLTLGRSRNELERLEPIGEEIGSEIESLEKKIMRLRVELAAIGEIDPNLVTEADESEKRHQFLSQEMADLETACRDLKKLIKDLEEKIHGDFQKYFGLINDEFNKYFAIMFGGGRAKLKLFIPESKPVEITNETGETIENEAAAAVSEEKKEEIAGIEIDLQIPRKKIKNLEMLSGGEKSLVSLAALFALISVSPPPFLVLDEIDAPLDETNARRFAELVIQMADRTQFIIITHNRVTMEAAHSLYGVTMGDDGVSKMLSLKLES